MIFGHTKYGAEGRETVSKKMLRCPAEQLVDGGADFEPGNTKWSRFTRRQLFTFRHLESLFKM